VTLAQIARDAIISALAEVQGDRKKAADMLGIGKTTVYRKCQEYGIPMQRKQARRVDGSPDALLTVRTPRFLKIPVTPEEYKVANAVCPSCRAKLIIPDHSGVLR